MGKFKEQIIKDVLCAHAALAFAMITIALKRKIILFF